MPKQNLIHRKVELLFSLRGTMLKKKKKMKQI